jgi:DNA topoisomerase I
MHDIELALEEAGLRRIDPAEMPIRRVKAGLGFTYVDPDGRTITHRATRKRITDLVIPPAWSEVRIASDPQAHLQAVGRDEAGRLQYIYHEAWEDVRAQAKAQRLKRLGIVLPDLRERVATAIEAVELTREAVIATAIRLIDIAVLRVGHEMYAGEESGRGAATLLKRHVRLNDSTIRLSFRGKGGKRIDKELDDPLLLAAIERLRRLRGRRLFLDPATPVKPLTANDINSWLGEVTGEPVTAKDFRTFHASAMALETFARSGVPKSRTEAKRTATAVARSVALVLANTPTVARKSYIHPAVVTAYEAGSLSDDILHPTRRRGLTLAETALMRFLEQTIDA